MSGDDEKVEPEIIDRNDDNSEAVRADRPKSGVKRGVLGVAAGAVLAVGAGGVGGFAAHEYFKSPSVEPDFSAFEVKFSDIEKNLATQTRKAERLEAQVKKVTEDLGEELTQLDARWSRELSELEAAITTASLDVANVPQTETVAREEGDDQGPTKQAAVPDIKPQLLAAVGEIRREFEQDVTDIKARLDTLETAQVKSDPPQNGSPVRFPIESFTAQLEGDALPVETESRLGKFLKKHVSLNRTGHAEAVELLQRIDAAIVSSEWDVAAKLSGGLPPQARSSVEEWIAATRP